MLGRELNDQFTMGRREWIGKNNHATIRSLHKNIKFAVNLVSVTAARVPQAGTQLPHRRAAR
jgi:hypothetical protein